MSCSVLSSGLFAKTRPRNSRLCAGLREAWGASVCRSVMIFFLWDDGHLKVLVGGQNVGRFAFGDARDFGPRLGRWAEEFPLHVFDVAELGQRGVAGWVEDIPGNERRFCAFLVDGED